MDERVPLTMTSIIPQTPKRGFAQPRGDPDLPRLPREVLERRLDAEERQLAESGYEFSKEDVWKEIEIDEKSTRIREKLRIARKYRITIDARGFQKIGNSVSAQPIWSHRVLLYVLDTYPFQDVRAGLPIRATWLTPIFHPYIDNGIEVGGTGGIDWFPKSLLLHDIVVGLRTLVESPWPSPNEPFRKDALAGVGTSEFQQGDSICIDELPGQVYIVAGKRRGGQGVVYKCVERDRPDLVVALKAPRPDLIADARVRKSFEREAEAWINLGEHSNIVTARFLASIANELYLVLEHVEGANLRDRMRGGALGLNQVVSYCMQICDGMTYAHTKKLGGGRIGLLHRDLKPENVLIRSADDVAKITDFGLAKVIQGTESSVDVAGTWQYMAPEQFIDPEHLDQRTDLYSFGVLFYELLTGYLPYDRPNIQGDLPLPLIRGLNRTAPEKAELLVQGCLQHDRKKRPAGFQQVSEFLSTLT
jgi:hypothetical protein